MKNNVIDKIVFVDIDKLKFSEYNPRKMDKKQYDELKKSIIRFGFVDPIIVNSSEKRKNIIIGGHFRVKVAKDLGYKQVPCVFIDIPDIEKEKELNLRLNKNNGDWDFDLLSNFDIELLKDVGFEDLDKIFDLKIDDEKEKEEDKNIFEGVFELRNDLINFPTSSKYGIPDLKQDMIFNEILINQEITPLMNSNDNNGIKLVLYDKKKLVKDYSKAILCFYIDDYKFENIWFDTFKIVKELKDKNFKTIITPNWSLFVEDPLALQIWNTYKSRYIGRYMQEVGIKIIPDINFSDEKSYEFCFDGLPEECFSISLQCQNLKNKEDYNNWFKGFNELLKRVNVNQIFLYGGRKVKDYLNEDILKKSIIIDTLNDRLKKYYGKNKN